MSNYFISGIGTDVGKTITSAVILQKMGWDYWKPVQAGTEPTTDTGFIKSVVSNENVLVHPEGLILERPMSPHQAAALEELEIDYASLSVPNSEGTVLVEGAGGLLVPITRTFLMLDLVKQLDISLILVVRHYLGSINHTLLSLRAIEESAVPFAGIVYTGHSNDDNERLFEELHGVKTLMRIPEMEEINRDNVAEVAANAEWHG